MDAHPTFLTLTGYEQVRSIVAALVGDWDAARRVELELPETGVCSTDAGGSCGVPSREVLPWGSIGELLYASSTATRDAWCCAEDDRDLLWLIVICVMKKKQERKNHSEESSITDGC